MATTINRAGITLTNDTGTPASPVGDGTLLSAADRTALLDAIDAILSGALTVGGVLSSQGFGTHAFSTSGTGANAIAIRNTAAGTSNQASVNIGNDTTPDALVLQALSTTFTGANSLTQIASAIAGGLRVTCTHASGSLFLATNSVVRLTVSPAGVLTPSSLSILAGFFAYNSVTDTSVANNTVIDFDTEVYDEGGHFSGDTFTAPIAGRYLLTAHAILTNTSGGAIGMQLVVVPSNHATGINIGYDGSVPNGEQRGMGGAVIVDMDASDTATVKYYGGGICSVSGDASQRYTWFSGRLLL